MAYFAGVDIGGTKIAVGLGTENGKILLEERFPTAEVERGDEGLTRIAAVVRELCDRQQIAVRDLAAVGVGSPGPLDHGTLLRTANLPLWEGINLSAGLHNLLQIPCRVENDATAAGMGEWMFGAGRGVNDMVYVTVSTGIGAGFIANGQLYGGEQGNAGELGHVVMEPGGPLCHCGNRGCLETLASGTAIARIGQEQKENSPYLRAVDRVDAPTVFAGARAKDDVCQKIIDDMARNLGRGLSFLVNLQNPARIVLGGGVMENGDMLLPMVIKYTENYSMPALFKAADIVLAGLGQDSGLAGALAVALVARI